MMTTRDPRFLVLFLLAGAVAAQGCVAPGARTGERRWRRPEGVRPRRAIDDFEDNNNQNHVVDGRGGYWYTYVDKVGSTVWPEAGEAGGTFTPSEPGLQLEVRGRGEGQDRNRRHRVRRAGDELHRPQGDLRRLQVRRHHLLRQARPQHHRQGPPEGAGRQHRHGSRRLQRVLQRLRRRPQPDRAVAALHLPLPRHEADGGLGRAAQAAHRSVQAVRPAVADPGPGRRLRLLRRQHRASSARARPASAEGGPVLKADLERRT